MPSMTRTAVILALLAAVAACGKRKPSDKDKAGDEAAEPAADTPKPPANPGEPSAAVIAAMPRPPGAVIVQHLQADRAGSFTQTYCVGGDVQTTAAAIEKLHADLGWVTRLTTDAHGGWRINGEKSDLRLLVRGAIAPGSPCRAPTPIAVTATARPRAR
jgi:hypothetical protein